jgi:hypothetical protein
MIMVPQEAVGMRLPPGSLAGLGQSLEKVVAVHVIQENVVSPIASAHDACPAVAFS